MDEIPEEFVPLKNFFRMLLEEADKKELFVLILLDSLELFFINAYQNGASSWLPRVLPRSVKIVLTLTRGCKNELYTTYI